MKDIVPEFCGQYVVDVDTGSHPGLITHPMLTRAYYEEKGYLLYPEYLSVGSDDDFTVHAWHDGVVLNARHLKFEHRHFSIQKAELDGAYRHTNREECWERKDQVLTKRLTELFGIGSRPWGRPQAKSLCIITPGNDFSAAWQAEWDLLYSWLMPRFAVRRVFSISNNIYQVRERAVNLYLEGGITDYVLWIDSDNPPKLDSFRWLLASLEGSEASTDADGPVDIVGAWYRYSHPTDPITYIAAGLDGFGERPGQLTEADVLQAKGQSLIEVGYLGFGMLLMRGRIVEELGPEGFWPAYVPEKPGYLMDDVSWCHRARERGYKLYLHPESFVEHLKTFPVASQRDWMKGETANGNHSNSGDQRPELQVVDHHRA